ncbi:acetyl-CoA carboxylase biotin carboxylase subunit family protein [Amycolatopsis sp. FDAARGOS 1241]|uniref:ATP-grasp domain-containing protein n=1 Tax=Amycolatopsis sp. FDAARGOS 1241 TaxID=2778070 RepID=UPI00194F050F|nr:ATP-grasp domain-containing protein [Amycolatopsis sp. FDAARGOS 1241]QRP49701.1 ATP-grasp domain-containing protein [Amycolatopsis sp. FDAARGOS 1241]
MTANIFVIGLDADNARVLERLPDAENHTFHGLLTPDELQHGDIDIADLLDKAEQVLDAFDGPVDAIVTFWDFPAATLVPLLCELHGLPHVPLEAILKCEHKYWSRLEQRAVIDEMPHFGVVDLDDAEPRLPEDVSFPAWLKPVKSFSSELAFRVADEEEFSGAVAEIRAGVGRVGDPFEEVLGKVALPREIAEVGGAACLAEDALHGVQAAVEGYAYQGKVTVYAALDSVDYPESSSFLRHQYPSQLPEEVGQRMKDVARRVMERIGFDNGTFSVEFFCDPQSGQVCLLEINPRHSQSHAELFELVDGMANHDVMVRLGLGQPPRHRLGAGPYQIAGRWYLRRFSGDAVVKRVPTAEEISALEEKVEGVRISVSPAEGHWLSELPEQDSYSFELAQLIIGARTENEMEEKYRTCVDELHFEFGDAA